MTPRWPQNCPRDFQHDPPHEAYDRPQQAAAEKSLSDALAVAQTAATAAQAAQAAASSHALIIALGFEIRCGWLRRWTRFVCLSVSMLVLLKFTKRYQFNT
jgi:hypothetical protein